MRFLDFQLDDAIANASGTKILYKIIIPNYAGSLEISCTEYYVINVIGFEEAIAMGPFPIYKSNGFWYANSSGGRTMIVFYFKI